MKPEEKPLFMTDHMVRKLGKYLRILGYDAEWHPTLRTHELIQRANHEGRIFLTRNTRLRAEYPEPRQVCVLSIDKPVEQLGIVIEKYQLDSQAFLFSRCIRCNVELVPVSAKKEIRDQVHPNVYRRHARFYRCPSCGTVFWHGSHVTNTCRKLQIENPVSAGDQT
jgi:hypothetical protein